MSVIVQNGDEVLRATAKPVPDSMFGSPELAEIIRDMKETLDAEIDGVALAAPQIGLSYRIFVVRYDRMRAPSEDGTVDEPEYGVFINPEIIKSSRRRVPMDEGCLSVRGIYGTTFRHERATVRAYDEHGKKFERGGGDILAQAFQHETDHLNGILFIDHAEHLYTPAPRGENDEPKKFIYFGTPYVSSDTLSILYENDFIPELVVSSPDAPQGRGMKLAPSETKAWALAHDLPVITPEKLNAETIEKIQAVGADYAIVVAYGKILPKKLIEAFPKGVLNVHYSLLPKYRGASPVESALLAGDRITGVSIQKMVYELDAGDVIASTEVAIEPTETTRELRPRLVEIGANLLADVLPNFEHGMLAGTPQDPREATHCGRISKEEGRLDLAGDATLNWNKYRAYAESPGTYFFANKNGKEMRVKIITAELRDGAFIPLRVVPEGKKEMNYADFIK